MVKTRDIFLLITAYVCGHYAWLFKQTSICGCVSVIVAWLASLHVVLLLAILALGFVDHILHGGAIQQKVLVFNKLLYLVDVREYLLQIELVEDLAHLLLVLPVPQKEEVLEVLHFFVEAEEVADSDAQLLEHAEWLLDTVFYALGVVFAS